MMRRLATMVGYAKAPKATYVLRHPKKGLTALAVAKGVRHTRAGKLATGVLGLGALAVAVPLGRYLRNR